MEGAAGKQGRKEGEKCQGRGRAWQYESYPQGSNVEKPTKKGLFR